MNFGYIILRSRKFSNDSLVNKLMNKVYLSHQIEVKQGFLIGIKLKLMNNTDIEGNIYVERMLNNIIHPADLILNKNFSRKVGYGSRR